MTLVLLLPPRSFLLFLLLFDAQSVVVVAVPALLLLPQVLHNGPDERQTGATRVIQKSNCSHKNLKHQQLDKCRWKSLSHDQRFFHFILIIIIMVLKSRFVLLLLVLGGEVPSSCLAFSASSSSSGLVRSIPLPVLVQKATSSFQDLDPQQEQEPFSRPTPTTTKNPTPVLLSVWKDWTQSLSSSSSSSSVSLPSIMATLCLATALSLTLLSSPDPAWAIVSGGRMGGSSFRSSASRSMSRPAPRASSYGGSRSRGSYGGGGYRSSGVTIAPVVPIVRGRSHSHPTPIVAGPEVATPLSLRIPSDDEILLGVLGFFLIWIWVPPVNHAVNRAVSGVGTSLSGVWTTLDTILSSSALGRGVTVAQLSVALEIPNRDDENSLLSILDRLAQTARTDSRVGLQNLTSQVALELLRCKASIVSAHAESKKFMSIEPAQRNFNARVDQERAKFEQETAISQYGGVNYSGASSTTSSSSSSSGCDKATVAVVTLVIVIDGDSTTLPAIRSMANVEQALQRIASDAKVSDCLQSAEILWTPQDQSETLTLQDVIADYPKLRTV